MSRTSRPDEAMRLRDQTRDALDFPTVKAFYAQRAQTDAGRARVLGADLLDRETQKRDFRDLDRVYGLVVDGPVFRFPDLPRASFFDREPVKAPFTREELRLVRDVLVFWATLYDEPRFAFIHEGVPDDPELKALAGTLAGLFDRDGHWREDVSPLYGKLIRQFFQVEHQLESTMKSLLSRYGEYLSESIVYERNHRRVLGVKVSFRGRVKGILHDYSSSGNTIYLEPEETVDKQNRLTEIESEIEEELWRIRVEMTREVLAHPTLMETICPVLARLDQLQALALTARETRSTPVCPNEKRSLHLIDARHPFLDEAFATQRMRHQEEEARDANRMVPFSLSLDDELRGLVISGANTGGKTVTLKTAGLMAWLANSGFPVPVAEGSEIPFYSAILADIGDNQSLSHNLSTFASHLANMRMVLAAPDAATLVLLDELGSGTDPGEGNALARALIEEICDRGFHLLVTTHQQILCMLAMNHAHLENGSMAFDARRLKPIYRFNQGVPGRSHALEIAESAGLPAEILARARGLIDENQVDIQAAIRQLQEQNKQLQKQKQKMRREELRLHHRMKESREEAEKLRTLQDQEKARGRERVGKVVEKAERELRHLIQDLSSQKQKRGSLAKLAAKRNELLEPFGEQKQKRGGEPEPSGKPPEAWKTGDRVFLKTFRREGVLEDLDRKRARVDVQGKTLTVDRGELVHLGEPEEKETKAAIYDAVDSEETLSFELKLLGYRVDDALLEVDRTVDEALRRGLPFLRIIHGHGSGALKQAVRDHLKRHVARAGFEVIPDPENDGVTEVKFGGD